MGSTHSLDDAFHEACRQGDLEYVRKLLPTMTYEEINRRGDDGNTPLHLACIGNHENIVSLLLQDERDICSRWKLNKMGLTAYESVQSSDIRQLFSRPSTSITRRFYDENPTTSFQPKLLETNVNSDILSTSKPPNNWLRGHQNVNDAVDSSFMCSLSKAPFLFKKFLTVRTERECHGNFEILIQECLAHDRSLYAKVIQEFIEYKRTNAIECLLRIYTMNTPIYGILQHNINEYATLLFLHLDKLTRRAFKGETYRGASMKQDDIDAYKWAQTSPNYLLETRTFQSTSKSKDVARMFTGNSPEECKYAVILTFIFENKCMTAIDLDQISHMPDEEEVLLFPFTLFKVDKITTDPVHENIEINLICVNSPSESFFQAWRHSRNT